MPPSGLRKGDRIWRSKRSLQFPPPRRGRVRVGATAAPLGAIFAGENNPHPNPPPTWGREKSSLPSHLRLACRTGGGHAGGSRVSGETNHRSLPPSADTAAAFAPCAPRIS